MAINLVNGCRSRRIGIEDSTCDFQCEVKLMVADCGRKPVYGTSSRVVYPTTATAAIEVG